MLSNNLLSPSGSRITSIPLINFSRSPSPCLRRQSESNSKSDTDDDDFWGGSTGMPAMFNESWKDHGWKTWIYGGGCGRFLFNTPRGLQLFTSVLILWLGGCQIGLILMNRIILWTGVYKFPYPLTTSLIELLITHLFILLSAYITRWFSPWLISSGLSGAIAPSKPVKNTTHIGFSNSSTRTGSLSMWFQNGTRGIAGGGIFEFDFEVAKIVAPCASIFVAKVCLSNLSFAYAQLQVYFLARIAIVPLSLLFTHLLSSTVYSVATISSALTATLTLFIAAIRGNMRITWESIVAGIFSSIFVALYPIQIQRTYKALVSQFILQDECFGTSASTRLVNFSGSKVECRAYWRILHYMSLLSTIMFLPIVILSGELKDIWRNCYILDVFFHWLMVLCGGLGSWAVFWSTIALTRATSPLVVAFISIPRAAFLLPMVLGWQMPTHSWIGICMCWASCFWFLAARRREVKDLSEAIQNHNK